MNPEISINKTATFTPDLIPYLNPGHEDESPMNKLLKSYLDIIALYTFGSRLVGRNPKVGHRPRFHWVAGLCSGKKRNLIKKIMCFYFEGDFLSRGVSSIHTP